MSLGPVKRSSTLRAALWGFLCVSLAAVSGCGSAGEATGDPAAAKASCDAYCQAYIAKACPDPLYTTLDACKMAECFHLPEAPGICQTKIKTYYDCQTAQADICGDMGCAAQFSAVLTCQ